MMTEIEETLADRGVTHGPFQENARISQSLKEVMRGCAGWERLTPSTRESLEMDARKLGRILAGDPGFVDHWIDRAGYATLVAKGLQASLTPATAIGVAIDLARVSVSGDGQGF
jgi:hypothetical protein